MKLRTEVSITRPAFRIEPCEEMLFTGSCFADNIGKRAKKEMFRVTMNPFGVMYNPASVMHTVKRLCADGYAPQTAVITLGTNHVYILNSTGEIADNCAKRPQRLFTEKELTIAECATYLREAVVALTAANDDVNVIVTVSPIRYAKYGFHGSALSKAVLLLAADRIAKEYPDVVTYFPAYEIVNDELRDYRFYAPDMLHPSEQAVEYIWEVFAETFFSDAAKRFIAEWTPLRKALEHKPFNPESDEYKAFIEETRLKIKALSDRYPNMPRYDIYG